MICLKYNVNETWLRTGEGEMFNPPPGVPTLDKRDVALKYISDLLDELPERHYDFVREICEKFLKK